MGVGDHACWRSCLHLVRLPALCSAGLRPHSIPKQFTRVVGAMGVHVRAAAAAAAAQHITRTLTHILPIIIRIRTAPPPWAACIACQRSGEKGGPEGVRTMHNCTLHTRQFSATPSVRRCTRYYLFLAPRFGRGPCAWTWDEPKRATSRYRDASVHHVSR